MRQIATLFFLTLATISTFGQDPRAILKKSFESCQAVKSGYYEMIRQMKYMSGPDTSSRFITCHFKKLIDDSIYSSAFVYQTFVKGEYIGDAMYTGDEFVNTRVKDSSATIMQMSLWAQEIKDYSHNYIFFSPLTNRKSSPLKHDSAYADANYRLKYLGEVMLNGQYCHHIQVNEVPENDSADAMKTLRKEIQFWINKSDFIPMRYSIAFDMYMDNDTMYQYEDLELSKYEINPPQNDSLISLKAIPSWYRLKQYAPFVEPEPLPIDTIAPNWELPSLNDEKVSLSSLRGKVVLVDFFYKSCYPCMQALPELQALHEKYKAKGLEVVGIDPYDTKEDDDILNFLSKRGVTYTVLLGGKETVKDYRVYAYPTLYIIDRNGNIAFKQMGYAKGNTALEDFIKKAIE